MQQIKRCPDAAHHWAGLTVQGNHGPGNASRCCAAPSAAHWQMNHAKLLYNHWPASLLLSSLHVAAMCQQVKVSLHGQRAAGQQHASPQAVLAAGGIPAARGCGCGRLRHEAAWSCVMPHRHTARVSQGQAGCSITQSSHSQGCRVQCGCAAQVGHAWQLVAAGPPQGVRRRLVLCVLRCWHAVLGSRELGGCFPCCCSGWAGGVSGGVGGGRRRWGCWHRTCWHRTPMPAFHRRQPCCRRSCVWRQQRHAARCPGCSCHCLLVLQGGKLGSGCHGCRVHPAREGRLGPKHGAGGHGRPNRKAARAGWCWAVGRHAGESGRRHAPHASLPACRACAAAISAAHGFNLDVSQHQAGAGRQLQGRVGVGAEAQQEVRLVQGRVGVGGDWW